MVGPGMNHLKFDLDQCSHGKSPKLGHLSGSKYPLKTQCLDMKISSRARGVRRQEVLSSESARVSVRRATGGGGGCALHILHETSQSFSCMESTLATRRLQSSGASVRGPGGLLHSCMFCTYDIIEVGQMWKGNGSKAPVDRLDQIVCMSPRSP